MAVETVRIDKFLWSVRLFKTRTLAAEACEGGKVRLGNDSVKPSRQVRAGDVISVRKSLMTCSFRVEDLCDKRQSASLVVNFITDVTPPEELEKAAIIRLQMQSERARGTGRPTKKDRREIDDWFDSGDE